MSSLQRVRYACYTANLSMSIVGNLPPVLFLTFHDLFGISYSLLGLLILINFCTQLAVDLFFSFFSSRLPLPKLIRAAPWFTILGLLLYCAVPMLLPALAPELTPDQLGLNWACWQPLPSPWLPWRST